MTQPGAGSILIVDDLPELRDISGYHFAGTDVEFLLKPPETDDFVARVEALAQKKDG